MTLRHSLAIRARSRITAGTLALVVAMALARSTWAAPAADARADSLMGLWGTRVPLGPELRGELRVARRDATWEASLGGQRTTFTVARDTVRFTMPGDRGGFRGVLSADRRTLEGCWIQPGAGLADLRNP